ncbi:hypothetical protein [Kaarinaea lacus]
MRSIVKNIVVVMALLVSIVSITAMKSNDAENWEAWFEEDFESQALAVNEGELEFLEKTPDKLLPLLENDLTISSQSLVDGWVDLVQCHHRIDPVHAAQVLYHARRTRNLKIVSTDNIERAWVYKNSVQMENISADASLCIQAQVKALYSNFNGSYSMRNGPFLRRFLDGFYPMRVTMDVNLPADMLSFEAINPQEQHGFTVTHDSDGMRIDALFVGLLEIEVYFTDLSQTTMDDES